VRGNPRGKGNRPELIREAAIGSYHEECPTVRQKGRREEVFFSGAEQRYLNLHFNLHLNLPSDSPLCPEGFKLKCKFMFK